MQDEQHLQKNERVQMQAECTSLRQKLQEQASAAEEDKRGITAASEKALCQTRHDYELMVAQMEAEHQAALDEANKALATSKATLTAYFE